MSASGTISNLQQALNCAGKCDCCANLQAQINDLKARIANIKPVDENRIVEATLLKVDPRIAAASVAVSAAITAKFDPRVREALERAFGADKKADTVLEKSAAFQREYQAGIAEAKNEARAAKSKADGADTKADGADTKATKAQSEGARAKTQAEIAESTANASKKEAAEASFRALNAKRDADAAMDVAKKAARESELYSGLAKQAKLRADSAYDVGSKAANEVVNVKNEVGGLRGVVNKIGSKADEALSVAGKGLAKAGEALAGTLEALGLSRRLQSELAQQALKLGTLALRVADIAALVIEVLVSVGLAEALGARVDAVERGQQQLSDDISKILGRWIPEIRGLARQAGLDASFARQLASSLSQGVSSALSQSSLALAGVRQASADAIRAIAISAAVQVTVGTAINLATNALTRSRTASAVATTANTTATEALKQSNGWKNPVKVLTDKVNALRNTQGKQGVPGRDGRPGRDGVRGIQGIQGRQGIPGKDGTNANVIVVNVPGAQGLPGRDGRNGRNGINGINGRNGIDVNPADVAQIKAGISSIQQRQNTIINNTTNITNNTNGGAADSGLLRAIFSTVITINGTLGTPIPKPNGGGVYTTNQYLKESFERSFSFFKWAVFDRAINLINLATTVHNAAMLSNDLGQTLLGAISNVLSLFGIRDSDGNGYNLGDIFGRSIENLIKGVIGTENYTALVTNWAKANRIYQASINIFNAVQGLLSTVLNALEITAGRVGKIGNALRKSGEVLDNAYTWMNPQPKFNRITNSLEALQNGASTIQMVTQAPLDVANAVTETTNAATEFTKALKEDDKPENKGLDDKEPDKLKTDESTSKTASAGKEMTDLDLEADEDIT